jgi:predicted glycoside hydrolase/deacetylase ChbG (UPF0249 family)
LFGDENVPDLETSTPDPASAQVAPATASGSQRLLVVNADDFGWSRSVNEGIIEAHKNGIVTRASILATAGSFEHALALAEDAPTLALGVHLEMYRGQPLLPSDRVRSLIGPEGEFLGSSSAIIRELMLGRFDLSEIEAEFRAQIERVIQAGIEPSHLDSEKHLHLWPSVFGIVSGLAREFGIPYVRVVREPPSLSPIPVGLSMLSVGNARVARAHGLLTPDGTIGVAESPTDRDALARLLASGRGRRVELVVHPGHVDQEFWDLQGQLPNKLTYEREDQLNVLAHPDSRALVERFGYTLGPVADREERDDARSAGDSQ